MITENRVALNYIYLSRNHGGGKDQVGLNLLSGFQENGVARNMLAICWDYSIDTIRNISKDITIIPIRSRRINIGLYRWIKLIFVNSFLLPRIIKEYGINCVLHTNCNTGFRKQGIKSAVIPHDILAVAHKKSEALRIPFWKSFLYKWIYEIDFRNADIIIAISKVDEQEIRRYYPKHASKVARIYNPIAISPANHFHNSALRKDIVAINIQFHHKNIITLIKAFEIIKNETDHNLILVGKVHKRVEYLKQYVEEHGLNDRVLFTGFVSDEEKDSYLRSCRLYVSPTLYEGFGMVSIEAVAAGCPVLLSKIPTNYEVTQGLCNYYEPADDPRALAKAMLDMLNKDIDEDELQSTAQALLDCYDYRTIAKQYWEMLSALSS